MEAVWAAQGDSGGLEADRMVATRASVMQRALLVMGMMRNQSEASLPARPATRRAKLAAPRSSACWECDLLLDGLGAVM